MVLKLRSVVRLIVVICVIFWLVNLFRWRASTIDDTEQTALPIHACSHKEKLIEAHTSTVQVWNGLFQHQVANGNLSFGLQTSTIGDCGIVMSNFSAPIIQGHLTESPFDRWSYSYQISNGLILMRTGDQRCSSLNINNVFLCIDYVRSVKNVLGRLTTKGVMVWLIPDVISSGQSNINDEYDDFEIKYLYHSLVIKYIIADGVVVVPAGTEDSLSSSLCGVLSALIPDNLKRPVSLQSAVQSVHDFIVSAHRLCKSDAPPSLHNVCYRHMHTRKYEPRCLPSLKQYEEIVEAMTGDKTTLRTSQPRSVGIFPLLITGLGGSGTHNVANILNGVGINVAHEGIAPYGSVSWLYGANDWTMGSSYPYGPLHPTLIVPYAGLLVPRYQHVLHLVRQPLRQIASVTSHSNFTYAFIMQFMELKAKDSVVQKFRKAHEMQSTCVRGGSCHLYFSALAWVHWNRHVRSYSDGTYLLEDLPKLFKTVCSLAYSSSPVKAAKCVEEANELNDSGTYSSQDISWWSNLWSSVRYHNADVHKIHLSYTMKDISDIDPELAVDIAHDMVIYGLNNLPQ